MKTRTKQIGYFLTISILILSLSACEKKELSINDEIQANQTKESTIKNKPPLPPSGGSPFYTDQVINETKPGITKSFGWGSTGWTIENGQYVATAYAHAYQYVPDNQGDTCYSKAQVMLVRNGSVMEIEPEVTVWGFNKAFAHTPVKKWYFDASTDLKGVTIVAQGLLWGCFYPSGTTIHWAEDYRVLFNLEPITQDPQPPASPTNLIINSNVALSWTASSGAIYYKIYRRENRDNVYITDWEVLSTSSTTSYTDYSVIPDPPTSRFYYMVQAVNNNGSSGYSNTVSILGNTYR